MKRFNPEKELNKIKNGNKNKIIVGLCILLIIVVVGYSFALYQVRYSNRLVYTTVKDFSKDIDLAVFINNEKVDEFPNKNEDYIYDKIVCDNNKDNHVTAYWNYDKWALELETSKKAKCNVYFKSGTDRSGANAPELYQGLIPITIEDDGTIKVADITKEWYNYQNRKWANAVLIDDENSHSKYYKDDGSFNAGTIMDLENDILQMYVWIPRYKYQLWNVAGENNDEQEIKIEFEQGISNTGDITCEYINLNNGSITEECTNKDGLPAQNKNWYTHPAFTFKGTFEKSGKELTGIWVGKFESSEDNNNLKIKPEEVPLLSQSISYMFTASRNIEEKYATNYNINVSEIDTHMMKNIEWGAMAYLTQSKYGRCNGNGICEEVTRNAFAYKTGYANIDELWNTTNGIKASTTGNIYGIYDTNGGAWEYVMGNMVNDEGKFYISESEFDTDPGNKYYDLYEYDLNSNTTQQRGHLGDATKETLKIGGDNFGAWYDDYTLFPVSIYSWFARGGREGDKENAGIFASYSYQGNPRVHFSFRTVITAQ